MNIDERDLMFLFIDIVKNWGIGNFFSRMICIDYDLTKHISKIGCCQ